MPYGNLTRPTALGSGGAYNAGTAGGGAIKLDCSGTLTVDGTVTAAHLPDGGYDDEYLRLDGGTVTGDLTVADTGTLTVSGTDIRKNTAPVGEDVFTVPGGTTSVS